MIGGSDPTSRYLAAVDLYNTIEMQNLWPMYGSASRIVVIVDGRNYQGFTITYADGATETWMVNPGHFASSVKLFDAPLPGSLKPADPAKGCAQG